MSVEAVNSYFFNLFELSKALDFKTLVRSFIASYGYINPPISGKKVVEVLKSIMRLIENYHLSRNKFYNYVSDFFNNLQSISKIGSFILIDDLGLPTILYLSKKFLIKYHFFLLNPMGDTKTWKATTEVQTLSEAAKKYGMHLLKSPDKRVHYLELKMIKSEPLSIEQLIDYIHKNITLQVLRFIKDAERPTLIVSDHAYDVARVSNRFILCHGFGCLKYNMKPIFSKLSSILIIG